MVKLPDPQICKHCGERGKVVNSRPKDGHWWRQRQCVTGCRDRRGKPYRWNTYETIMDPTLGAPTTDTNHY